MSSRGDVFELDQIQRWMQAVIMHAEGVVAGIQSHEAQQAIDLTAEDVEDVICRSNNLNSIQRLGIYAIAYYARLLECLRNEYAALAFALGDETFDSFAFAYLQSHPSRSYTLNNLGRDFPQFLRDSRPAADGGDDAGPSWPDLLIDLATLERTYAEVFDGPGVEGQRLLAAEDLLQVPADQWHELRLEAAPCLRLLQLQFPVHEYVTAVRRWPKHTRAPQDNPLAAGGDAQNIAFPSPERTFLVVTRRDFVVRRWAVTAQEFDLLSALVAGQCLGETLERLAGDGQDETLVENLQTWFQSWSANSLFVAIQRQR